MVDISFRSFLRCAPAVLLCWMPDTAGAHLVNTDVGVFYAGMMHPLTSTEHLLPTLAVAALASQLGKAAVRRMLLLFPLSLAAGALIGTYFPHLPFAQTINLCLLVVLAGLLGAAERLPPAIGPTSAVCIGLILGYRSGVDMAAATVGMQFIPGVVLTGVIVTALVAAWVPKASSRNGRLVRVFFCAVLGAAGLASMIFPSLGLDLQSIRGVNLPGPEEIVSRIRSEELSAALVFAALTGSLLWGAGHALTPGHGKALVAAYLVGTRGTPRHAVSLGLTVTATHTLMVFALGSITLLASRYFMPEQLYSWLGLASGLTVTAMGAAMTLSRFRSLKRLGVPGHHHHHGHDHPHVHHEQDPTHHQDHHGHTHSHFPPGTGGEPASWRALLGLGISGGLLPCPAALVLLLTAMSMGRVGFGMILVTVFSLGLAGVLIAVGLLFIKGGRLLAQNPQLSGCSRWLPVFSAVAVFGIGVLVTMQAAAQ